MALAYQEDAVAGTLIVKVTGMLVKADYERFVQGAASLIQRCGKIGVLIDMQDLHGWATSPFWQDNTKSDLECLQDIERLAMVGDRRWGQGMDLFFQPFGRSNIRYFDRNEAAEARAWIEEAPCAFNNRQLALKDARG